MCRLDRHSDRAIDMADHRTRRYHSTAAAAVVRDVMFPCAILPMLTPVISELVIRSMKFSQTYVLEMCKKDQNRLSNITHTCMNY